MRLCLLLLLCSTVLSAMEWTAQWITVPGAPRNDYGVYHFRKVLTFDSKPGRFTVHVSADNRYQLYVNGQRMSRGPARGDVYHWRYETVDIARALRAGRNVIAAVVWNFGADSPMAQISVQTGFLLQGDTPAERAADTNRSWKCSADSAYQPLPVRMGRDVYGYYVAGAGERVDGRVYPWGWETADFDDSGWDQAVQLGLAADRGARDAHSPWMMIPRPIPAMEERAESPLQVRVGQPLPVTVAAGGEISILFDQGYMTTGFPLLTVRGGRGAEISLRYAESLFEKGKRSKGNRNEVEGKEFRGNQDIFISGGGDQHTWSPLWWRAWRYIEMRVKAARDPVTVEALQSGYSGYPFVRRAKLATGDPGMNAELQRFLDVSWRTLRIDAHETFVDCYYEQLQYIGDTRLEALAAFTLSGDARLVRNALLTLADTRTADGLTQSRGPANLAQYIPPFSLIWIGMLQDYAMYQDDPDLVRSLLPTSRSVLSWFAARRKPDGRLGPLEWWNYMDWVAAWPNGVPPNGNDGGSAILDLLYLNALQWQSALERLYGSSAIASEYDADARRAAASIRAAYWDSSRGLVADTADRRSYSQHANALAILAGVVTPEEARSVATKMVEDRSLTESTLYFRYYIHSALRQAGLGDRFLDLLGAWRDALAVGLTTWPEQPEPSRSDAHAWSSHIAIDLFRTMLGIRPAAPGFKKVIIEPHLGKLAQLEGSMPHPKGEIAVAVDRAAGVRVNLPEGVEGELIWNGQRTMLRSGANTIR